MGVRMLQALVDEAVSTAGGPLPPPINFTELGAFVAEERDYYASLLPQHPDHPTGLRVDKELQTIDLYWGGYRYEVDVQTLQNPMHVLWMLHHVCTKAWRGINRERVAAFIDKACRMRGWDVHSPEHWIPRRGTDADQERAKLTPQLRWAVLTRDGFRCRACGACPETGAVLHIDHIVAIANGGRTELKNLQALCAACNLGKGRSR